MPDAVSAHVEFIEGEYIFGIVVADGFVDAKFAFDGFRSGKQVTNLYVENFILLFGYEVNFL